MDLFELLPFKNEMAKLYHGLTDNATHTSEKPVFSELRVRRYDCPIDTVSDFIVDKIENWVGWNLKSQKTAVGGMKAIRAEVSSFVLLGMKIDVSFGLIEETDINGRKITTVNGKAHTNIDSKGDLGESRRMLRMILGALDFQFGRQSVNDTDYAYRSLNPISSNSAFQQLFDETKLEHRPSNPKPKAIEFKKSVKQEVQFTPSRQNGEPPAAASSQNGSPSEAAPATGNQAQQPSKPKITVISLKKNS
ncbi:MAG: hypothetical protein HGB29_07825 [Chlorobiaceae bacterium]|nr:hypothetical protein [Chlorobiaceae bacterium]NTW74755.1 hypothetical protein [Chlorobiaceae bacterium]